MILICLEMFFQLTSSSIFTVYIYIQEYSYSITPLLLQIIVMTSLVIKHNSLIKNCYGMRALDKWFLYNRKCCSNLLPHLQSLVIYNYKSILITPLLLQRIVMNRLVIGHNSLIKNC